MPSYEPLDATITVNDLLLRFPEAIGTLSAHGIDTCCRGEQSLARAAAFVGVDPDRLLAEISAPANAPVAEPVAGQPKACACGCHDSPARTA